MSALWLLITCLALGPPAHVPVVPGYSHSPPDTLCRAKQKGSPLSPFYYRHGRLLLTVLLFALST